VGLPPDRVAKCSVSDLQLGATVADNHKFATDAPFSGRQLVQSRTGNRRIGVPLLHSFQKPVRLFLNVHQLTFQTSPHCASNLEAAAHDFRTTLPLAIYKDRKTGQLQVLYSSTFSWSAYFLTVRRSMRQLRERTATGRA